MALHQFGDASLIYLKKLTKLQELILNGPSITDAGMVHLKGLTRLQELELRTTEVAHLGNAWFSWVTADDRG